MSALNGIDNSPRARCRAQSTQSLVSLASGPTGREPAGGTWFSGGCTRPFRLPAVILLQQGSRSARVRTLRARLPAFFKLLSSDIVSSGIPRMRVTAGPHEPFRGNRRLGRSSTLDKSGVYRCYPVPGLDASELAARPACLWPGPGPRRRRRPNPPAATRRHRRGLAGPTSRRRRASRPGRPARQREEGHPERGGRSFHRDRR